MPAGGERIGLQAGLAFEGDQLTGRQASAIPRKALDDNADLPLANDDETEGDAGEHKQHHDYHRDDGNQGNNEIEHGEPFRSDAHKRTL